MTAVSEIYETEIRCPVGPKQLFMKLIDKGERPKMVEGNLMEFACYDCRRDLRRAGGMVAAVFHRYNFLGELIETEVVPETLS